jgi:ABC-type dipeptide/oligopeptide/nickel transport system permease component
LDKPTFYFALTSAAYPKELYKIQKAHHRQLISRLIDQYGNSDAVMDYYEQLKELQYNIADVPDDAYATKVMLRSNINDLFFDYDPKGIEFKLREVTTELAKDTNEVATIANQWQSLITSYQNIIEHQTPAQLYIPKVYWYGGDNQYHTWMFGDYPWLGTVDSSHYYRMEALSVKIKQLRPEESSISRSVSTLKGKNFRLEKKIAKDSMNRSLVDSLQLEIANNNTKIEAFNHQKATISKNIAVLFEERDSLFTTREVYASKGFLRGDFGTSYTDGKKVADRVNDALFWTVIMNIIAILLAYFISIPLGVNSAKWKMKGRKVIDNTNTTILFILYSLPNFWIGTLLLVFFTTAEYAEWMDFFPSSGAQDSSLRGNPDASIGTKLLDIAHHLFLPVFCITYGSLAYLSRQMRGSMLGVIRQDYIRTARAKGLSERKVIWKHAFRNSLFPIITLFSSVFPRTLSGSIAIEMIYAIPGMGYLLLMSITSRDWPIVFAIVMLVAILAMIGNLIADILYAVVDPRIKY